MTGTKPVFVTFTYSTLIELRKKLNRQVESFMEEGCTVENVQKHEDRYNTIEGKEKRALYAFYVSPTEESLYEEMAERLAEEMGQPEPTLKENRLLWTLITAADAALETGDWDEYVIKRATLENDIAEEIDGGEYDTDER